MSIPVRVSVCPPQMPVTSTSPSLISATACCGVKRTPARARRGKTNAPSSDACTYSPTKPWVVTISTAAPFDERRSASPVAR